MKPKQYRLTSLMCALACMAMTGCSQTAQAVSQKPAGSSLHLMQATDLHYLSPSLTDNGTMFAKVMANGDGKMSEYSSEILDALITKVTAERPDAFLLSGDITFNGEKQSLQEVQQGLAKIEEAGIPVLVIPGNHDIAYPFAYAYEGDGASPVANISQQDFKDLMKQFGYDEAIAKDPSSFSYVYPLSADTWLLAMDANTEEAAGSLSEKTMQWLKQQLAKAEAQHITVITMSHQNVLTQSKLMYEGFVMDNHEDVSSLLKQYHVMLNLSGHSHLQHTSQEDDLTDVCTESLSLYPIQYGDIQIDSDHAFKYQNEKLGILEQESFQRFDSLMSTKLNKALAGLNVSQEQKATMLTFALQVNLQYFTGNTADLSAAFQEEGWQLWQTYGSEAFWFNYLQSIEEAS